LCVEPYLNVDGVSLRLAFLGKSLEDAARSIKLKSPLMMRLFFLGVAFLVSLAGTPALAQQSTWVPSAGITEQEPAVLQQRLVASHGTVEPGQSIQLAWEFTMQPAWHIYWQNAGDSGLPPELRDTANAVLPLTYPVPTVIAMPPVTNYGYKKQVTFTAPYTVPSNLPMGPNILPFKAEFLYCKDVCLPGTATLELPLMVGAAPVAHANFAPVQSLPEPLPAPVAASVQGLQATLELPTALAQKGVRFVPHEDGVLDDSAAQLLQGNQLQLKLDNQQTTPPSQLKGLLLLPNGQGYTVEVPLAAGSAQANPAGHLGLGTALFFAFLAGLILNLMPCVLPVLSLKILSLVKHHAGPARTAHTLAYTGGVLVCFWAFAALIAVLQASGASLGWGFHLQQPLVVAGLTLLMVGLTLNFWGVFELGSSLTRLGGAGKAERPWASFATGALAVIVATPCTVPFMGGAMAYALTQSVAQSVAVFTALGLGMAAPFLVVATFPKLLKFLPKPGAWMVTFKHALGWPMLATALWLAFVYNSLTGQVATFALLSLALLLALGLWLYGQKGSLLRGLAVAMVVLFGLWSLHHLNRPTSSTWQPWSTAAVAQAQAENRPVFIDFTADWCLTCKVTEATVLNTAAAQDVFAKHNVVLLRGDWTRQDAAITAELAKHGRKGVPLYLLYRPNQAEPEVLPQLLTVGLLAEKLGI
jgi:thiol:disulfide interchange protein DsbD